MMNEKEFVINYLGPSEQFVIASRTLGRVLMRDEIVKIVGEFGSRVKMTPGDVSIDIIPPIPKDRLPELGEALVQLAQKLDPTPPPPTYKIV
jgi:hypothetical protein